LLRWSDYRELGELKGALARHAEAVFSTLSVNEQKAFPLVMRHLVTLGQAKRKYPTAGQCLTVISSPQGKRTGIRKPVQKALLIYSLQNGCWLRTPIRKERSP
jgi:hypothetical protein